MYSHHIEPFGSFKKHIIENTQGDSFTIVPEHGANLIDLKFKGQCVIDGFQTADELIAGAWGKSIILFPYPNRLRDGRYTFDGKTYQFDINNADTGNSIHGFSSNVKMDVVKSSVNEHSGSIVCEYNHDGSHPAYPFKFTFQVQFTLSNNELKINMAFTNNESFDIPVGLGWHPYFKISKRIEDTALQMPETEFIQIDDRMLPTGEKTSFNEFDTLKRINSFSLDNGFYILNQSQPAEVILESEMGRLTYWQETGAAKWNFLQVFTPPKRNCIALEPMTCNIDAFNNKDGLVLLKPQTTLGGNFGVRFSQ
jgi:aldose 1-epimerase